MPPQFFNFFARLVNFFCPGIVQLYQGRYHLFLLLSALPFALIFLLSWSKLIFFGLALFYLPITFICVQLIAAFFIRHSPLKKENKKPLIYLMVCIVWCVVWYGLLYLVALNKSWLLGFDLYRVTSSSMEPTLFHGEYVLADTKIKSMNRNDIVFFQYQPIGDQVNVKRVFALAGDSVKIESGKLPAFLMPTHQEDGIKIRDGEVFVTGDNVTGSFDSREFGAIPSLSIKAKAMTIYRDGRWVKIVASDYAPDESPVP